MSASFRARWCFVSFGVLCASLATAPAHAQATSNAAVAQGLYDEAKALMSGGKAAEACPKFEESQRLDPASGTLLNLANCYEQTGRTASAWSAYLEAAAAARSSGNKEREQGAKARADALASKVSKLIIDVAPEARLEGLRVTRDGAEVGVAQWGLAIPVDEGSHQVVASAAGRTEFRAMITVEPLGRTATVTVPVLAQPVAPVVTPPAPVEAPVQSSAKPGPSGLGGQKLAALVAGGVGIAGVAVGTIFGVRAMSKKKDADDSCVGSACETKEGVTAGNAAHDAGTIATVGMIVGAVGLAGGAVFWFTAPEQAASIGVGYGRLTLRGSF